MDFAYINNRKLATRTAGSKEPENKHPEQQSIITRIGKFFSFWNPFSFSTEVHTVKNMATFFTYLDHNLTDRSLVIFDIDRVLLHRSIVNSKSKRMVFSSVVESVNKLSKYADVVCITARNFLHTVNFNNYGLNLCHSHNNISLTRRQIEQLEQQQLYFRDNIFYTEHQTKPLALNLLCSWLPTEYSTIFFIDDQFRNCQDIASFGSQNNMNIQSFLLENPNDNSIYRFQNNPNIRIKSTAFFHKNLEIQVEAV